MRHIALSIGTWTVGSSSAQLERLVIMRRLSSQQSATLAAAVKDFRDAKKACRKKVASELAESIKLRMKLAAVYRDSGVPRLIRYLCEQGALVSESVG